MSKQLQFVSHAAGLVLIAVIAGAIGLALLESPPPRPARSDDWRRTANGWERRSQWPDGFAAYSLATQPNRQRWGHSTRFDTHPSVLALAQLVGVLLSFYFFPPLAKDGTAGLRLPALIGRSFRASAFGS